MPAPASRPTVIYVARPAPWVRGIIIAVGAMLAVMIGSGAVGLAVSDTGSAALKAAALALVVPAVLVIALVVVLGQRMRFTVTTDGVVIRTMLRTRRVPWAQIARVEVDTGWVHQGQTLIILHDGRRIGAPITQARAAMRRGESTRDHGPRFDEPARPTRAAIATHQRWLRGEFARSS